MPSSGHDIAIEIITHSSYGYLHWAYQKLIMSRGGTHVATLSIQGEGSQCL